MRNLEREGLTNSNLHFEGNVDTSLCAKVTPWGAVMLLAYGIH